MASIERKEMISKKQMLDDEITANEIETKQLVEERIELIMAYLKVE